MCVNLDSQQHWNYREKKIRWHEHSFNQCHQFGYWGVLLPSGRNCDCIEDFHCWHLLHLHFVLKHDRMRKVIRKHNQSGWIAFMILAILPNTWLFSTHGRFQLKGVEWHFTLFWCCFCRFCANMHFWECITKGEKAWQEENLCYWIGITMATLDWQKTIDT